MKNLRKTIYKHLHTEAWTSKGLSPVNKIITILIVFSIIIVIIETEPSIYSDNVIFFSIINTILALVFLLEYLSRVLAAGENPEYSGAAGRLKYATTFAAIIDLAANLPFLLGIGGSDTFLLRVLRLLRIFALAKLGRFSVALRQLRDAVVARSYELLISLGFAFAVLFASSTAMYLIEGPAQPEAFGSIPRALWWSITTLTTVGYGDVYPITALGKLCVGATAFAAIIIIAMPTGVMAAAFSDAFQRRLRTSAAAPDGA